MSFALLTHSHCRHRVLRNSRHSANLFQALGVESSAGLAQLFDLFLDFQIGSCHKGSTPLCEGNHFIWVQDEAGSRGAEWRGLTVYRISGALFSANLFLGVYNGASVQPVVSIERSVFYRERSAGMYSALPYATAQVPCGSSITCVACIYTVCTSCSNRPNSIGT